MVILHTERVHLPISGQWVFGCTRYPLPFGYPIWAWVSNGRDIRRASSEVGYTVYTEYTHPTSHALDPLHLQMGELAGGSWGEMVREIEMSKKVLPWQVPGHEREVPPVVHVRQRDVKLKEREVDPVLMRFRDPEREQTHQERSLLKSQQLRKVPHATDSMFSLLSHTSESPLFMPKEDRNGSKYHILSKLPLEDHKEVPTLYDETAMISKLHSLQNKVKSKPKTQRRYDILTNMFIEDHDAVSAKERERLKQRLDEAYWRTHRYNLIQCRDFDPSSEDQFQRTQKVVEDRKRERRMARLPKRCCAVH